MRSLFITGTDTDSGKTFAAAGITAEFRRIGINAVPAKPVQTGCVNGISQDLLFTLKISGLSQVNFNLRELSPYVFRPACSPHLAAELSGVRIELEEIVGKMNHLSKAYDCVIAEGAGGVLVPLGPGKTMLDLMKELGWPVVLVSRDRLGAINHTLLSINALRNAGLEVAGVVVNHADPPSSLISKNNSLAIREYGEVEILGEIPFSPDRFPYRCFRDMCRTLKGILSQ